MIEATNSTAHIQVVDADKVVKRSKRQSQWTLLDPRTGRPVGWAIIIIIMHGIDCDDHHDEHHHHKDGSVKRKCNV